MAKSLAHPLRVVAGRFVTVDQGSDDEIVSSADASLLCPQGHRNLLPAYGRPPVQHTRLTVDRQALLRDSVIRDEPRIVQVLTSEEIENRASTIRLQAVRG